MTVRGSQGLSTLFPLAKAIEYPKTIPILVQGGVATFDLISARSLSSPTAVLARRP